jgi:hypothetical protein
MRPMNPQEYEALRSLLAQLVEIHGVKKDPEADLLIRDADGDDDFV